MRLLCHLLCIFIAQSEQRFHRHLCLFSDILIHCRQLRACQPRINEIIKSGDRDVLRYAHTAALQKRADFECIQIRCHKKCRIFFQLRQPLIQFQFARRLRCRKDKVIRLPHHKTGFFHRTLQSHPAVMVNILIIIRKHRDLRVPLLNQILSHLVAAAEIIRCNIHEICFTVQVRIDGNHAPSVFFAQASQLRLHQITNDQSLKIPRDRLL